MPFEVNQAVICNGYDGTVDEICEGQLAGMIVVHMKLARGKVCVSATVLERFNHEQYRVENLKRA